MVSPGLWLVWETDYQRCAVAASVAPSRAATRTCNRGTTESLADDWTDQAEQRVWFLTQTLA
ncbi:hypothetical protein IP81_17860 [Novosphingobium sp. AAP83]|nr:hypothetical protein IP81_17860 [Novosphingobium sp. AAP83]